MFTLVTTRKMMLQALCMIGLYYYCDKDVKIENINERLLARLDKYTKITNQDKF